MKDARPAAPGPGAYQSDAETSLFSGVTKRIGSRGGTFAAAGPRFKPPGRRAATAGAVTGGGSSGAETPGPGAYSAEQPAGVARAGRPTSTFASSTVRMRPVKSAPEPKYSEFEAEDEVLGAPQCQSNALPPSRDRQRCS